MPINRGVSVDPHTWESPFTAESDLRRDGDA